MADLAAGCGIDFDGYLISPGLYKDLCSLDLLQVPAALPRQCLIVGIGVSARAPQPLTQLTESLRVAHVQIELKMAKELPIWSLVGLVSCPALIRETQEWMKKAVGIPDV